MQFFDTCPVNMGIVQKAYLEDFRTATLVCGNPATSKFLHYDPPRTLYNVNFSELPISSLFSDPDFDNAWTTAFKETFQTGQTVEFESNMEGNIYFNNYARHIRDNTYIFLSQNITARKQLEIQLQLHKTELEETVKARTKQLEDALDVKSRFLATMSHEIRTPLSGIIGMLTLLSEVATESSHQEMIRIALVCGDQLMAVINDILDLCRLENKRVPLEASSFSLIKMIEESLEVVAFGSEKKGLELIYNVNPLLPDMITGDPARIRQVMVNLLSNAVKFSNTGDITVTTIGDKRNNSDVWDIQIAVQDHGIGISDSAKEKLFTPFQQADSSYTRKYGGSGLGLVISKKIVELMGGTLWLESKEGEGSTFFFRIPVTATLEASVNEVPKVLRGKRALVVESNPTLLKVSSFALKLTIIGYSSVLNLCWDICYQITR
jgi:signal transduction histidine kinase